MCGEECSVVWRVWSPDIIQHCFAFCTTSPPFIHNRLYWTSEQLDHRAKWSDITLCICNGCVHFIPLRQLQFTLYAQYVYSTKSIVWLQSDMKYIFGSSWNSLKGLVHSETYGGARLRPVHRWVDTTTGICHGWSVYKWRECSRRCGILGNSVDSAFC